LYILALCSIVSVLSCVTAVGSVVAFDCNYNKRRLLLLLLWWIKMINRRLLDARPAVNQTSPQLIDISQRLQADPLLYSTGQIL